MSTLTIVIQHCTRDSSMFNKGEKEEENERNKRQINWKGRNNMVIIHRLIVYIGKLEL